MGTTQYPHYKTRVLAPRQSTSAAGLDANCRRTRGPWVDVRRWTPSSDVSTQRPSRPSGRYRPRRRRRRRRLRRRRGGSWWSWRRLRLRTTATWTWIPEETATTSARHRAEGERRRRRRRLRFHRVACCTAPRPGRPLASGSSPATRRRRVLPRYRQFTPPDTRRNSTVKLCRVGQRKLAIICTNLPIPGGARFGGDLSAECGDEIPQWDPGAKPQ